MSGDGIYLAGMIRNHGIAEQNARAADQAEAKAKGWYERAMKLEARITELEGKLKLEEMISAGRKAQVDEMKKQHADSPLMADSGKRFKDGDMKTELRLIYEQAFDAKGREMGIANPADRRQD